MVMIGGSHLLNALGINSNLLFKRLERVEQQVRDLQDLADSFGAAAGFMGPGALAQMLQSGGIPSATHMHGPPWGGCMCPGSYAMPRTFDFGSTGANPFSLRGLMDRQRGMMFERMLTQNPFARAQAEVEGPGHGVAPRAHAAPPRRTVHVGRGRNTAGLQHLG
ncbi:MAG: hypothetical protein AAFU79_20980, partial [Myxococcota bacterium]